MALQRAGRRRILGLLIIGGLLLYFFGGKTPREPLPAEPVSNAAIAGAPAQEVPSVLQAERDLASIVDRYARSYHSAPNDMAKGALRPQRAAEICRLSLRDVSGWIGRITTLSSNNDGSGVLEMRLSEKLSVGTWNNSISDFGDHTLIPAGSVLHKAAVSLQIGQLVTFSGHFVPEKTDCLKEKSLTVTGAMTDPTLLFRFEEIHLFDGRVPNNTRRL
jgi:hypothetical protein